MLHKEASNSIGIVSSVSLSMKENHNDSIFLSPMWLGVFRQRRKSWQKGKMPEMLRAISNPRCGKRTRVRGRRGRCHQTLPELPDVDDGFTSGFGARSGMFLLQETLFGGEME
ncbi:MAG: hypothetical protein U0798_05420 [Gemmataceae bacterium]